MNLLKKGKITVDNNPFYDNLYIDKDISILLTSEEEKKVEINYELDKKENFQDDEVVGKVLIKLDGKVIGTETIYVKKDDDIVNDKKNKGFWEKLLDIIIFWR